MVTSFCPFDKSLPKMNQYDLVLLLHEPSLPTDKMYERLVEVNSDNKGTMSDSIVITTYGSWTPSEERFPNSGLY
jgi:hypothetical protein